MREEMRHPARTDDAGPDDRHPRDVVAAHGVLLLAACSTYGTREVGSASTSRLATSSSCAPSRIFFTGSSSFFPVRFRGIAGTAAIVSGMCRGDRDVRREV